MLLMLKKRPGFGKPGGQAIPATKANAPRFFQTFDRKGLAPQGAQEIFFHKPFPFKGLQLQEFPLPRQHPDF
jgi:hypothetical protein